ncbi:MAG: alpha/beta hydrolase [Candidatus Vogelbacteria bacterium]|nr:alpha/beta hydrolase [Candidatus Vogelbacteria bacterium]
MGKAINKKIKSKDGINIYYDTYDPGANKGPTLFFVHGVGGDLDAWQYLRKVLHKKGFSSIAMDLRGHGYSDHPCTSSQYQLNNFIDDVISVVDAEEIDKVILIGHSLGAVLTTHVALYHQDRIERLILISSSYLPPAYFKIPGIFLLTDLLAFLSPPPVYPGHSSYPQGKHHKDIEIFGLIRTIMRNSFKSYALSSKEILKSNIEQDLKTIKVPTLIISGDRDSVFPARISKYLHSQISGSELKIIGGANHVIVLNNVDETVKCIYNFLSKQKFQPGC